MKQLLLAAFFAIAGSPATAQTITTIAGNGTRNFTGDGGPAAGATLHFPIDVLPTSAGVYILDQWNDKLRLVNNSGIITTIANGLNHPRAMCDDAAGNIYIGDEGNPQVKKVAAAGGITTVAGNTMGGYTGDGGMATDASIEGPYGLCTDASGNLYLGDYTNNVVRRVNTTGTISTFAGTGAYGHTGDGGPAILATCMGPAGMCFDAGGNMYFTDRFTVRKINAAGIVTNIAGTGTSGYSGDGGPATAATISEAIGICIDASGNLFFADYGNNVIRKVTPAGTISTYAGTGVPGFSGDNGPASAAQLSGPQGVRIDASGNMYIADYNNQRIRMITPFNVGVGSMPVTHAGINVYPNPVSSVLFIDSKQPVCVHILSLDGRTLLQVNNAMKIDMSGLAPGNYLLCVLDPMTGARLYNKVITKVGTK